MSIYTRDNLASSLSQQLEAALNRRQKYVENDAARRDSNVKAINSLVKSIAYAQEDDLDDKKKKLMAERNAALKAQEDANKAILEANERSLNEEQKMDGYRPLMTSYPDQMRYYEAVGTPTDMNQYEAALGMTGYYHPNVTLPRYTGNRSMRNPEQGRIPRFYLEEGGRIPQIYLDAMLKHGEGIY